MRRFQVLLVALAAGAPCGAAAQTPDTKSLTSMKGACVAQFLGNPLPCGPQAMYAVRTNGQEFVAFSTAQGVVLFFGDKASQPTPTDRDIAIDDSRVDLPNGEKFENNRLRGDCHLTRKRAGGPITAVVCDATNLDTGQRERFELTDISILPPPK